jgi:hypothetical protein
MKNIRILIICSGIILLVLISREVTSNILPNKQSAISTKLNTSSKKAESGGFSNETDRNDTLLAAESEQLTTAQILDLPKDDPRKRAYLLSRYAQGKPENYLKRFSKLYEKLALSQSEAQVLNQMLVERQLTIDFYSQPYANASRVIATIETVDPVSKQVSKHEVIYDMGDPKEYARIFNEATKAVEDEIRQFLGDDKYKAYSEYINIEVTRRSIIGTTQQIIEERSHEPISDVNAERLLAVVVSENGLDWDHPNRTAKITDAVIQSAKQFLSEAQLAALLQLKTDLDKFSNSAEEAIAEGKFKIPK